jgi:type VI secretion system secreted protein VgrG
MVPTAVQVSFEVEGSSEPLTVRSLSAREAISELYEADLIVTAEDGGLDFGALVGKRARVTLRDGAHERLLHGLVCRFEELPDRDGKAAFRAVVVPRAALLDMTVGSRVLASLSAPEIVDRVLREHGITTVRTSLTGAYARRDVAIQYRESDWAFLSRLLESEGIHYHFEHGGDEEVLVLSDREVGHDPIDGGEPLPFRPEAGALSAEEGISRFGFSHRIRPARMTVRDYPENPRVVNEETASANDTSSIGMYEFPATRASLRLQQARASRSVGSGRARSLRLAPGRVFSLREHPREDYGARYLVTRVEHTFESAGTEASYSLGFQCVPATEPYRPERKTPVPRIHSVQSATVVGPQGLEIHTDELGRVLVRFQWDRDTSSLESACWVPVAHHAAGAGHGAVNVPRAGDAVLVEFLDGDPDRPIVNGRVYNLLNKHPYALPANGTKAVFRDASTPGGNGYNELTFDSAAGAEQVYLRAQRDLKAEVLRDAEKNVGQDDRAAVTRDLQLSVGRHSTATVGGDEKLSVEGAQTLEVTKDRSVTVEGNHHERVHGNVERGVGGDRTEIVEGNLSVSVEGADKRAVSGDVTQVLEGARTTSVTGDDSTTVGGNSSLSVSGNHSVSIAGNLQQVVDGATSQVYTSWQLAATSDLSLQAEGELRIESATIEKIGAPKVYIAAGSKLYLRAREEIILEVGDSKLTITSGKIYVSNGDSTKTLAGDTVSINC